MTKDWINLFNNKYDNVYYELEVDLKQINTTITTWEQLLNAYSSIQFNNLNNLQVKCAPPNIENFIPNRNINILGGYSTCENNLGWFSNGKLKVKVINKLIKLILMVV